MTSLLRTTIGCLAVLGLLGGVRDARADTDAANGFDMGSSMGFASFQASVSQQDLAHRAISEAQGSADRLTERGLLDKVSILAQVVGQPLQTRLEQLRAQYEQAIRRRSNSVANAYRLGLLIALAESQCTSPPWESGRPLVVSALNEAAGLIAASNLKQMNLNPTLLNEAQSATNGGQAYAYARVSVLRYAYREAVLKSSSQQRAKRR